MKKTWITSVVCGALILAGGVSALVNDAQDEKQVLATMETYARAYVKKDMATLSKIYHENLLYAHSTNHVQNKAEVLEAVSMRATDYMKFSQTTARIVGTTTVVRTRMAIAFGGGKEVVPRVLWVLVKSPQGPHGWQILARQTLYLKTDTPERYGVVDPGIKQSSALFRGTASGRQAEQGDSSWDSGRLAPVLATHTLLRELEKPKERLASRSLGSQTVGEAAPSRRTATSQVTVR